MNVIAFYLHLFFPLNPSFSIQFTSSDTYTEILHSDLLLLFYFSICRIFRSFYHFKFYAECTCDTNINWNLNWFQSNIKRIVMTLSHTMISLLLPFYDFLHVIGIFMFMCVMCMYNNFVVIVVYLWRRLLELMENRLHSQFKIITPSK